MAQITIHASEVDGDDVQDFDILLQRNVTANPLKNGKSLSNEWGSLLSMVDYACG